MGSHAIGTLRCCPDELVLCPSWSPLKSNLSNVCHVRCNVPSKTIGASFLQLAPVYQISHEKFSTSHSLWRACSVPVGLEKQSLSVSSELREDETESTHPVEGQLATPSCVHELKSLHADSHRSKLLKKLSEANQHNRFLKRQTLVSLADEIAKAGIPEGSRKINGKYIHSHLVSRLEAVQQKLQDQIKDVAAAQSKEVSIIWIGMAESVQVMGSFDGWSQGEHLSPEYLGSYTLFSTSLVLRPGRYEIKFLVDGEWKISPEFPTIGEGLTENNLLVVE